MTTDPYNGITLNANSIPPVYLSSTCTFAFTLQNSLHSWRQKRVKGVLITHLTSELHAPLIPIMMNQGFDFHSVQDSNLTLCTWLPDTVSRLPQGPTHAIRVGLLMPHPLDINMILVVRDMNDRWTIPIGQVQTRDDELAHTVCRALEWVTGLTVRFRLEKVFMVEMTSDDICCWCLVEVDPKEKHLLNENIHLEWMNMDDYMLHSESNARKNSSTSIQCEREVVLRRIIKKYYTTNTGMETKSRNSEMNTGFIKKRFWNEEHNIVQTLHVQVCLANEHSE